MLDKLCRDPSHLEQLLEVKLAEERELQILNWLQLDNIHDVEEWKENIHWLMKINQDCGFQCETFAFAVHILDNFLRFVKVHGKYLKCATLAAYYIAVKVMEEEEFVPSLSMYVMMTGSKFTSNDITRMEKIMLEKTDWDLNHVTACSFLEIFYSIICAQHFKTLFGSDSLAYSIFRNLANQVQHCICSISLLKYKGSVKALALLSCTLEKITSRWFLYVEQIALRAKLDVPELLECRDIVKSVVFGQHKKPRAPRLRKFAKRHSMYAPRRSPLAPIVENPFEAELLKNSQSQAFESTNLESVIECRKSDAQEELGAEIFNEELKRLRKISLDDMQFPSPAKRRKLSTCSIESKYDQDVCGMLTSPVKPLPV